MKLRKRRTSTLDYSDWFFPTPGQLKYLRINYRRLLQGELTEAFNKHFGTHYTEAQVKGCLSRERIHCGRPGYFQKGLIPWNYGTKGMGIMPGRNVTSFKKGNIPPNRKPLGTERIDPKDGCIYVKVRQRDPNTGFPTRYLLKHRWIWETIHGPIPPGMAVAFKDGNQLNCKYKNLMLISRAELLVLNQHRYKTMPKKLKPVTLTLAKLEVARQRLAPAKYGREYQLKLKSRKQQFEKLYGHKPSEKEIKRFKRRAKTIWVPHLSRFLPRNPPGHGHVEPNKGFIVD
jgi:hypothetical protein